MMQSQGLPPLIRGLLDAAAYPHDVRRVQIVQTHISYVLLAGPFAYKIKKPLDLGFLDYSTLERRREMCEEEVRLNRRLCTGVYLGTVPIVRHGDRYAIDAGGAAVEYAVKMRRVPSERMMPALLAAREVRSAHMRSLAHAIATFHAHAETNETIAAAGRLDGVHANWDQNFRQIRPFVRRYLDATELGRLEEYVDGFLRRHRELIEQRAGDGRTRDVHGDLRADSVVFDGERTTCIMDCIEFDPRLRHCDVASDVAFLMTDLDARGFRSLADEFIAFYLERVVDETLTCMLPFYGCYRAVVRGKVHALESNEEDVPAEQRERAATAARERFQLALRYAEPARPPMVIVMSGLTGSGKSFVAHALAARIGAAVVTSDAIRVAMFASDGTPPMAADSEGAYTDERRAAVYEELRTRARGHLEAGRAVVLDATHERRADREAARTLARDCGARAMALLIESDEEATRARLDARAAAGGSMSGGTWDVHQAQRQRFDAPAPDERVLRVNRGDDFARDLDAIVGALDAAGREPSL
ncbi:MAG TPA: AAA family ATPase [Dehalococcoidia bacterium]|nr:AAA family ATPase [Dehalococcoidia bacterium]